MKEFKICSNCFNPRLCIENLCDHCASSHEHSQNKAHWDELPEFDIWGFSKMTDEQISDEAYCDAGLCYLDTRERTAAIIRELAIRSGILSRDNDQGHRPADEANRV